MDVFTVLLSCVLVGQTAAARPSSAAELEPPARLPLSTLPNPGAVAESPTAAVPEVEPAVTSAEPEPAAAEKDQPAETGTPTADAEAPVVPAEPARLGLTPPEILAEVLALPPGGKLSGEPLTLRRALSGTADRRQQLTATHAYWRLAEAVAIYHVVFGHHDRLQRLAGGTPEAAVLRMARASSAAVLREAELGAIAAQHELAALLLLPSDAPLPLPADRPHVGPYRTRFDTLFARQTPPARARLIDRMLPVRCRAIEGRALAIEAAEEALTAAAAGDRLGRADLAAVLQCMETLCAQRRALVASVCRYNEEIADYALAVAGPGANPEALVAMLIQPTGEVIRPLASDRDAGRSGQSPPASPVEPARLDQPVPTPAAARPPAAAAQAETVSPERPVVPIESAPTEPAPMMVKRPGIDGWSSPGAAATLPPQMPSVSPGQTPPSSPSEASAATAALYPGLVEAPPGTRARQLTLTLHWDVALPKGIGEPISLEDCLRDRSNGDRRGLIEAFWLARQRAAEYQLLVQQAQMLESLIPPDGQQASILGLRAAGLTTEAALRDARVALMEAQFALATRMGRQSEAVWPMPATAPHSGRYLLRLNAQPRRLVQSWPLRRLAAMIPGLAESVQEHATAVVEADAARAAAEATYQAEGKSIEPVLAAVGRQTEQTRAFLETLTDYNRAIAEYALMVLPPETPSDRLVAALVVQP